MTTEAGPATRLTLNFTYNVKERSALSIDIVLCEIYILKL